MHFTWVIFFVVVIIIAAAVNSKDPSVSNVSSTAGTVSETTATTSGTTAALVSRAAAAAASGNNSGSSVPAETIKSFTGNAYIVLNSNEPEFSSSDLVTSSYEYYSPLDSLGRCGPAIACLSKSTMPTAERGSIGSVKPTGWHTVKYDNIDGKYLYNRCHLIAYELSAENANKQNLITGTRYLNINGMLPFENMTADYIKETGNHVLYRVTPIFEGNDLVASGVHMEAESVEDKGAGIKFNVYCYNVQPGISIDYATGNSTYIGGTGVNATSAVTVTQTAAPVQTSAAAATTAQNPISATYVLNTSTKKFHRPGCRYAGSIKAENRQEFTGDRQTLIDEGYTPCGVCDP